ncbi:DUF1819 family protein [Rarobacter faecitabidus]|uniref:Putative inner membrane protein DUF1819 n=1 Tax=Rarobacter faecitabidus TaxID=13243 RepID=A0A542ZNS5_RARFA|nr:DUF1819 family protein [Rarobacter faecitabidus]TQL62024.1 putative inner membrane protein DUF1819 [Rarobacter faecitabidus]
MGNGDSGPTRYTLSFTSGALLVPEGSILAETYLTLGDWGEVRRVARAENLLRARTLATAARRVRETVQRLETLAPTEILLLSSSVATERGYVMWLATCRRYQLIGEFAEEVVRERYLLLTPTLRYEHFDRFVRGKMLWHPELTELRESTMKKLRATVFRMLEEAGLLYETEILGAVMSDDLCRAIQAHRPDDVRFLPTRDSNEAVE